MEPDSIADLGTGFGQGIVFVFVFICDSGIEPRTLSMLVKYSTTKLHPRLWLKRLLWTRRCLLGGEVMWWWGLHQPPGPGRLEENFHVLALAEVR